MTDLLINAVYAAVILALVYGCARLASFAYFKSKREHTRAMLREWSDSPDHNCTHGEE